MVSSKASPRGSRPALTAVLGLAALVGLGLGCAPAPGGATAGGEMEVDRKPLADAATVSVTAAGASADGGDLVVSNDLGRAGESLVESLEDLVSGESLGRALATVVQLAVETMGGSVATYTVVPSSV